MNDVKNEFILIQARGGLISGGSVYPRGAYIGGAYIRGGLISGRSDVFCLLVDGSIAGWLLSGGWGNL